MLTAVKTKRNSQLLLLNQKGERVIVKVPTGKWVVLDVKDSSKIINKDSIIAGGGEIFSGLWSSTPPFGKEMRALYLQKTGTGGFNLMPENNFSTIKSVSPFALQAKEEDERNSIVRLSGFNPVIQKNSSENLTKDYTINLIKNSNKIAALYSQLKSDEISADTFKKSVDEVNLQFLSNMVVDAYNYYESVIGFDGIDGVNNLRNISPSVTSTLAGDEAGG